MFVFVASYICIAGSCIYSVALVFMQPDSPFVLEGSLVLFWVFSFQSVTSVATLWLSDLLL